MPLEATMIIIDNSEYMRNGDYQPTRFDAQKDAVTTVFQAKVDSNPENLVGLMTMAGKGPEVLATNTKDLGHILGALHTAASRVGGLADISTAISVSQLALKHRQNKNLRQRVVVFVGSPLSGPGSDEASLVKLAKKLKKNSVNVDIVAFGEGADEDQSRILRAFVETVSQGDSSHLVVVPPGPHLLSELLNSSPILAGDRGIPDEVLAESTGTAAAGAAGGFEFGVDPSLDPELAMALRMSMEEEQARQAAAAQASGSSAPPTTTSIPPTSTSTLPPTSSTSTPTQLPTTTTTTTLPADPTDDEEEAMLKQAIALSQSQGEGEGHDVEMGSHEDAEGEDDHEGEGDSEGEGEGEEGDEDMTEEEAIARAIEMSMKDNQGKQGEKK